MRKKLRHFLSDARARISNYQFSFQLKVTLLAALILLSFLLTITAYAYQTLRTSTLNETINAMHSSSQTAVSEIEQTIDLAERIGMNIIGNTDIRQKLISLSDELSYADRLRVTRELEDYLLTYNLISDEIAAISWTTHSGETLWYLKDTKTQWYPDEALTSSILNDESHKLWMLSERNVGMLCCIRTIRNANYQQVVGSLAIYIPESRICELYAPLFFSEDTQVYLVDQEGNILSARDKTELGLPLDTDLSQHLNGVAGTYLEENQDVSISNTLSNGWQMLFCIPGSYYMKDIAAALQVFLYTALLLTAVAIWIIVAVMRQVTKPINELAVAMRCYGRGDFTVRSHIVSKNEIGMLSSTFNRMADNCDELREKMIKQQVLRKDAELKYLQMQINPHFLFNTLDAVHWSAIDQGAEDAAVMTRSLAMLMRSSLDEQDCCTLGEELENLNHYLTIQKMRYGDKLNLEKAIPADILEHRIPKLMLQPIAENAIVHGISQKLEGGLVKLTGSKTPWGIQITIEDTGVGMPDTIRRKLLLELSREADADSTHIGIKNVRRRLLLYYGSEYTLRIESTPGVGTRITIPFGKSILPQ